MNNYRRGVRDSSSEEISQNSKRNSNVKHTEYVRRTWTKRIETDKHKYRPIPYANFENDIYKVPLRVPVMFHPPEQKDLETVIREFENNFLKPTEVDASNNTTKDKSFVKKIVSAFEDKYKAYNESKIEEDVRAILEDREILLKTEKPSQWRCSYPSERKKESIPTGNVNTLPSTSKYCRSVSNEVEDEKMSVSFSSPDKKRRDQKNTWKTIWTSPFKSSTPKESKLVRMLTGKYNPNQKSTSGINEDDLDDVLGENFNATSTPLKTSKPENPGRRMNPNNNRERNAEMPEDINNVVVRNGDNNLMLEEVKIVSSSSKYNRMMKNMKRESVEDEDNAIALAPPTEKERSRNKALKKLFSKLTYKKSKNVYEYENVNKNPYEFRDSGYGEMCLSSSPLNKSTSTSERNISGNKLISFRKKLYPSKSRKLAAAKSLIDIKDKELKSEEKKSIEEHKSEEERSTEELKSEEERSTEELKSEEERSTEELKSEEESSIEELKSEEESSIEVLKSEEESSIEVLKSEEERSIEELNSEEESSIEELKSEEESSIEELKSEEESSIEELKSEEESSIEVLKSEEESSIEVLKSEEERSIEELKSEEERSIEELKSEEESSIEELKSEEESSIEELKSEEESSIEEESDPNEVLLERQIRKTDLKTNSIDRKSNEKPTMISTYRSFSTWSIPKYLHLSDIPNNLSVSVTETDNMLAMELYSNCSLLDSINETSSDLEADEIEELKNLKYPQVVYKKFFSQSESRIHELRAYNDAKQEELLSNYTKPHPRPATTSFYEDVLSLRRRMGSLPDFYSCPEYNPVFATIKRGHRCKFCDNDRQRLSDELQSELCTSL